MRPPTCQPRLVGILGLAMAGCGAAPPALPPIAARCTAERVGTVAVTGAPRNLVAGLTVLEGTLLDEERAQRIRATAIESLRWRGYARAEIDLTKDVGCFTDLNVAVTLGPQFKIARINFETDDDFPAKERLAVLEDELGAVNTVGGVHIDYRLKRALGDLEKRYHDAGWLDAQVYAPRTDYDDEAGEVSIRITIDPGERYRIGAIRALGGNSGVRRRVLQELGVEEGAWYDGPTIRRGIERARKSTSRKVELRQFEGDGGVIELEAIVQPKEGSDIRLPRASRGPIQLEHEQ